QLKGVDVMPSRRLWTVILLVVCIGWVAAQTAPPTLTTSMPPGAMRGATMTLTVEGTNLSGADGGIFSQAGLSAKVTRNSEQRSEKRTAMPGETGAVINDHSVRNKMTIEVTIAADVPPGRYNFRIKTPLGLTNTGALTVGAWPEIPEKEPNNS